MLLPTLPAGLLLSSHYAPRQLKTQTYCAFNYTDSCPPSCSQRKEEIRTDNALLPLCRQQHAWIRRQAGNSRDIDRRTPHPSPSFLPNQTALSTKPPTSSKSTEKILPKPPFSPLFHDDILTKVCDVYHLLFFLFHMYLC